MFTASFRDAVDESSKKSACFPVVHPSASCLSSPSAIFIDSSCSPRAFYGSGFVPYSSTTTKTGAEQQRFQRMPTVAAADSAKISKRCPDSNTIDSAAASALCFSNSNPRSAVDINDIFQSHDFDYPSSASCSKATSLSNDVNRQLESLCKLSETSLEVLDDIVHRLSNTVSLLSDMDSSETNFEHYDQQRDSTSPEHHHQVQHNQPLDVDDLLGDFSSPPSQNTASAGAVDRHPVPSQNLLGGEDSPTFGEHHDTSGRFSPVEEDHAAEYHSHDSSDTNDFVKLEKPQHMFESAPHHHQFPDHKDDNAVITPSDDVAVPSGEDLLQDFASPQEAAHDMKQPVETLEQFIADADTVATKLAHEVQDAAVHAVSSLKYSSDLKEDTFLPHAELASHEHSPEQQLSSSHHASEEPELTRVPPAGEETHVEAARQPSAPPEYETAPPPPSHFASSMERPLQAVKPLIAAGEDLCEKTTKKSEDIFDLGHSVAASSAPPVKQEKSSPIVPTPVAVPKIRTTESCCGRSCPFSFCFKNLDPRILDLIYWRDVKKSGVVFGATMLLLLSLAFFSVISVFAYASLTLLFVTVNYRVFKYVTSTIQKTEHAHPFKQYLEKDLLLPQDKVHEQVDIVVNHIHDLLRQLRRLFLVEDIFDSLKFGILLWALTYIGAWFSGIALVMLAFIAVFTIPKFYEIYKEPIDQYYGIAHDNVTKVWSQVQEKLPFLKKKQQ